MWFKSNQKVLGAFVIGLAMVAGAYIVSNFNIPGIQQSAVTSSKAPVRTAIAVTDNDQNGIEDWRDAFLTAGPIIIGEPTASYTPPTTITGKLGVSFFQDIVRAKNYGALGKTQEQVIADTVAELSTETNQVLYGITDISVLDTWTDEDIKNYANTMAGVITRNNQAGLESELVILNDILVFGKKERATELEVIASIYKNMRDESLLVPVPKILLKQHLDLINTYEAVYKDIYAMSYSLEDPAVALLRIKRYEDDALGLRVALQNMYDSLQPYAGLFTANDPALLFASFNNDSLVQP
jgi:hypothetical protein